MIDMETYKKLHPSSNPSDESRRKHSEDCILAKSINETDGKYQFLLPPYIKGYNLRHKKWFEISADGISDVKWNREAFQSLVIERKSKELIQALVTSQIEAEKATDLISGKGSGLILLLHGGPGTGKTLTAESVAEIAEKPLYRVTCGDVGTKAEQVEKYLESVLYLGRIWGCVVLLDEADVFLEQRSLEDLERNALVSVFLRVLEYYEGILILTSNRVGTFDEAFRSRIQLALHYPSLGPEQRFRIWSTFIERLEKLSTDEEIDIDDLRDHLGPLKDEEMNGRQIRNVITTARQYAKWKKEPLTYQYLKDVIEISGRFDGYLNKLHGGFSNDEIAQHDGLRCA
jgi:SpoVK/Ycf46/Vps4 family AAA+-type ATPase